MCGPLKKIKFKLALLIKKVVHPCSRLFLSPRVLIEDTSKQYVKGITAKRVYSIF